VLKVYRDADVDDDADVSSPSVLAGGSAVIGCVRGVVIK
jgi:hypothetical protein